MKQKFFNKAKALSKQSSVSDYKLGCVIVKRNRIIGMGYNEHKTDPNSNVKYKTIHAEFKAIKSVVNIKDLKGSTIYVYRETKNGVPACSKPCSCCELLIKMFGIKNVYHT